MNFLNYKQSYTSTFSTSELRERITSTLNEQILFGLLRNSGELTDSTFKIKGVKSTTTKGSFFPVVLGRFEEAEQGTNVDLKITPGLFFYIMEGFALVLIFLLVISPSTTINGEPSTLAGRLTFGTFFISIWTLFLGIFTIVAVQLTKNRTESILNLTKRK